MIVIIKCAQCSKPIAVGLRTIVAVCQDCQENEKPRNAGPFTTKQTKRKQKTHVTGKPSMY